MVVHCSAGVGRTGDCDDEQYLTVFICFIESISIHMLYQINSIQEEEEEYNLTTRHFHLHGPVDEGCGGRRKGEI